MKAKSHMRSPAPAEGGGVLPYMALTGTCGPIGYGFQGFSEGFVLNGVFHQFVS